MQNMRLLAAAGIIGLVILAGFALSVPHTRDLNKPQTTATATSSPPVVSIHDHYAKGTHTITGTVSAPDACTSVSADATTTGNASSTAIALALSMPQDVGVCLQLPTDIPFSVSIAAPASASIDVTVNGAVASTTSS